MRMTHWKWAGLLAWRGSATLARRGLIRQVSVLTVLGMAFGVASLLVALAVVSGFEQAYRKGILGFNAHLVLLGSGDLQNWQEPDQVLREGLSELKDSPVRGHPFIYREGLAVSGDHIRGLVLKGVDTTDLPRELRIEQWGNASGLILGRTVARDLGIKPPEPGQAFPSIKVLLPKNSREEFLDFVVTGIFTSGLHEYDSGFAFLPLESAQQLFGMGDSVSGLEYWLSDPEQANRRAQFLEERLLPPLDVLSWDELNEAIFQALKMERTLFAILMSLLIVVATFNLAGTLTMILIRRRPALALLSCLGATGADLKRPFWLQGMMLASVGSVTGILFGLAVLALIQHGAAIPLAPEVYLVDRLPVHREGVGTVLAVALGIGAVVCAATVSRIRRLQLVRALHEAN